MTEIERKKKAKAEPFGGEDGKGKEKGRERVCIDWSE